VQTKNLTIYGNIFSGAGNGGFFHTMYESDISFNLFQNQSFYGIYLTNSANNSFHHNSVAYTNLAKSTTEESQAYDSGTRNDWHDENKLEGNWWSSWKRKKAYEIDGSANSIDPHPLEEPPILPTMRKPLNTERLIWALIISILSVGALVFVLYKKKIKPTQYDTISQDTDYYPQQQTYAQNVLANCKYCGSKVDADSLHCSSCGKKIKTL
ncbi:MAG: hypothetical protein H7641_13800, partial [Candidatus Heimdallarchaeota archaeon]|nr:hypothetical protein [Candidatus Heimdallarchaeota archaeon]MCK4878636.1 hypothetical protein [Candidatus Heimdallarchaeota archaeon]